MEKKLFLVYLHSIWISQKKLWIIFEKDNNYEEIFNKLDYAFLKRFKIRDDAISNILDNKKNINTTLIEKKINDRKVKIIIINDKEYPDNLKQISNPPYLLYVRWKIDNSPKIAVVWARNITSYWKNIIEKIIPELSKYFCIVSGGAAWCDSEAHKQTLESGNKTIAVIWTWIDNDYPTWNKKMFDLIVQSEWAIVSIFPVWEVWNPYNFPVRNEIVAGLSVGTLVVEAKIKSWSLITANLSLDLWRDLFAVPWDIFKLNSEWCNNLIKTWQSKMVVKTQDILEEYNCNSSTINSNKINIEFNDEIEKDIYNYLLLESLLIDELAKKLNLDSKTVSFKLSFMEINGYIRKITGWKYEIA